MRAAARKLRRFLAGGPKRWKEIEAHLGRDEARGGPRVSRPRAGAAVGHLGAAARRPLRSRRGVDRRRTTRRGGRGLELLVRRYLGGFGPADPVDVADFGGVPITRVRAVLERIAAAALPRRERQGARRPAAGAAPRRRSTPAPAAVPAGLGRHAARPRSPHADPPGDLPVAGLQHQDAELGEHVPARRPGGRDVALGGREGRARPVRRILRAQRRALDDGAARLAAFHR